jgi:S1-C subfamily serine protease
MVDEPQSGSPAAKAGIESGDVITAVNGTTGEGRPRSRSVRAGIRSSNHASNSLLRRRFDLRFPMSANNDAHETGVVCAN